MSIPQTRGGGGERRTNTLAIGNLLLRVGAGVRETCRPHFSKINREQEACQNCRFLRCRGYKEAKIIFALLHLLPGMSYPLQYLVISLRMRWLDNCTGLRSAGATRSAVLCPWEVHREALKLIRFLSF